MTKETLEKAKLLDENIYYINNLLYVKSSIDKKHDMIKLDCRLEVIKR